MLRLQSWISMHALRHLGPGVSAFDFVEPLDRRLADRVAETSSEAEFEKAIKVNIRYLVKEQKREMLRKAKQLVPISEAVENLPDPRETIAELANRQQEVARELLGLLDKDVAEWLEKLHGFEDDELPRSELAKQLGIRLNTLDARLSREYRKLRAKLNKGNYRSRSR